MVDLQESILHKQVNFVFNKEFSKKKLKSNLCKQENMTNYDREKTKQKEMNILRLNLCN